MSVQEVPSPSQCTSAASSTLPRTQFPTHGLLPRIDTQASEFVRKHPSYDGRGTVVAVLDTGIDPGAQGLQITSDGKRKVVDFVDCTGSGDVVMSGPQKCLSDALELRGASGRMLRLNPKWTNPSGEWRVGAKRLYDVAPLSVKSVAKRDREERFHKAAQTLADSVSTQLAAVKKNSKKDSAASSPASKKDGAVDTNSASKDDTVAELEAQASVLSSLSGSYEDHGPMLDCIVFHDGTQWRAAIDTEADGDLSNANALGAYKTTGDVALLCKRQLLYFTLNFYDAGHILSIVTSAGPHSTHVAGILAANHPEEPQNNGVAPGAQLISLLIGDHRVSSLETGVGLTRAVGAIIEHNADLANMSFGEPSATHNSGQWVQMIRKEVVRRHRCIFVSSAGNEGPALSTVGAPGGTNEGIIGVGAFVGEEQIKADHAMYDTVRETAFTWCSRGPTFDGARGSDIFAPGSAIASYPAYTQQRLHLGNGTSMSSPNLCGCLALLVSAWKQEFGTSADGGQQQKRISPFRVKNAILATAKAFGDELGAGLMQTDAAWQFLKKYSRHEWEDVEYAVVIPELGGARGVYLRNPEDSAQVRHLKISIAPVFPEDVNSQLERDPDGHHGQEDSQRRFDFEQRVLLVSDASWVRVPEALYIANAGQVFNAKVDATQLEPGRLHIASIDGYDSTNVGRGPIFTIPVTVTKPLEVGASACVRLEGLRFQPTDVVRRFIAVPVGATRARITVYSGNSSAQASAPAVFYLHCLQISPQQRFNAYELKQRVSIGHPSFVAGGKCAEQRYQYSMNVLGGATLEVCVAQFWSQLGNHEVDVTVDFNGISPAGAQYAPADGDRVNSGVVVNGNYGIVRTDFCANIRPEYNVKPKATLEVLRMAL
ncbi:hypothetical protein GGI23_005644, partial [Coemansia sp. RSA 2559]